MKKQSKQLEGQLHIKDVCPIKICGYRQNCYRKDSIGMSVTASPNRTQATYLSLEKKNLSNGYVEGIISKDYPINSESVSSLAEGADYRNDPAQAIAQTPKRVNLGDVTEAQAFLDNPQQSARLFNDVKAKLAAYYSAAFESTEENNVDNSKKDGEMNG